MLLIPMGLFLFKQQVHAQTETDTTFRYQMNTIFANVDKSKVPYGYLRDYAMEFTNLENYNGTTALVDSNNIDASVFWNVFRTLYTARVYSTATGLVNPDTLKNRWFSYRQPGRITLAGIYCKYSRFRDDAANNYITVSNNLLYDKYVSGVWQNPYQTEQVFAMSPSITLYKGRTFNVLLPANLWFTNSSSTVSNISINTGSGYVTVTPGTPVPVSYTDTATKQWTYRLTLTDGSVLYAHSLVKIINDPIESYSTTSRFGASNVEDIAITASEAYLGVKASGTMTIKYADADRGLRRPLIIAEGYDPGIITKPEYKYGESDISQFTSMVSKSGSSALQELLGTAPAYDIIYVNWQNGVDYIQRNALLLEEVIRWVNANKEPLTTGGYATNVVVGESMGGLCARYALKDMENKAQNHQTRLFVSYDAPFQGANTPQGYQHMARHLKNLYVRTGSIAQLTDLILGLFNEPMIGDVLDLAGYPASQQMLITYVNTNNVVDNSVHNAWQTELKNLGYPKGVTGVPFRMVAISNGSECGKTQAFSPGANLFTISGNTNTTILGDLLGQSFIPSVGGILNMPPLILGSLPGRNNFNVNVAVRAQADGTSNEVYKGQVSYTKKVLWLVPVTVNLTNKSFSSSAATLPYDYFGGGRYDANNSGIDINNDINFSNWLAKANLTVTRQRFFCFVPTPSALDIGSGSTTLAKADYLASYVGGAPPASPKNSPFANFITAFDGDVENQNELHISIWPRNGDWLSSELKGVYPSANCSSYCNATTGISGPTTVLCATPQTYSVNVSSAISYDWEATPKGMVTLTPNGSSVSVAYASGSGNVTLSVTVETPCGTFYATKTITTGPPAEPLLSGTTLVPYPYYGISSTVVTNEAAPYKWYVDGVLKKTTTSKSSDVVLGGQCGVQHYLQVEVSNACGVARNVPYYFTNSCTARQAVSSSSDKTNQALVSPNPASSTIIVTAIPDEEATGTGQDVSSATGRIAGGNDAGRLVNGAAVVTAPAAAATVFIRRISMYDMGGKLLKDLHYTTDLSSQVMVSVGDLSAGVYVIAVTTSDNKTKRQKVVIAR
jgi:hypothetical protein